MAMDAPRTRNAEFLASLVERLLQDADAVLAPIVGKRATERLSAVNLQSTAESWPWLQCEENDSASVATYSLRAVIAAQQLPIAEAASLAVIQNFYLKLTQLIGLSLTEKLLRPVWESSAANIRMDLDHGK